MAIAESIIDVVSSQAEARGLTVVHSIKLEVGKMTGIVADSLRFSFEFAARGTVADGADLDIELLPITALCGDCRRDFIVKGHAFNCPHCGSTRFEISGGNELRIVELDVKG